MIAPIAVPDFLKRIWARAQSEDNAQTIIFLASLAVGAAWFFFNRPSYSCDTQSYLTWIAGAKGQPIPSIFHTIQSGGYPAFLMLFGISASTAQSVGLYGVLAVQFATAVAIPVLIFRTLRLYDHRVAFVTAILAIVSLAPYFDAQLILPHQLYKFLLVLLVYLFCNYTRVPSSWRTLALLSLVVAALCIFQPLSPLLFPIVFLFLLVARPRQWKAIAGGAAFVLVVVFSHNLFTASILLSKNFHRFQNLAFHDLYVVDNAVDLAAEKGPARRDLRDVLENYPVEFKDQWRARIPTAAASRPAETPAAWATGVYAEPRHFHVPAIGDAVALTASQAKDDALRSKAQGVIKRVLWEVYSERPSRVLSFLFRYGIAPSFGATAERLFYRVFYIDQRAAIAEHFGPASREYINFIRWYLAENPDVWARIADKSLPANDRTDMDALVESVLIPSRDADIFQYGWSRMDEYLGHYKSFIVHFGVLRESLYNRTTLRQEGVAKGLVAATLADWRTFYFGSFSTLSDTGSAVQCLIGMPWQKADSAQTRSGSPWFFPDRGTWSFFHFVCSLIIVILFVPCLFFPLRLPVAFAGALLFFHGAISTVYSKPQVGDVDKVMPLAFLLTGIIVCALLRAYAARSKVQVAIAHAGRYKSQLSTFVGSAIAAVRSLLNARFAEVLKFCAVNLAILLALLTGIELAARYWAPERSIYGATQPGQYSKYHPYLAITNEASLDRDGLWWDPNHKQSIPYHIKTNRLGFRMDRELDTTTKYQKAPNEKVVLIFGSSTVYGFGSMSNETTLAGWLQKTLNERQDGTRYTVFNMGNGWWIAYQQLAALQLYGLMLDPDWIIFMDGRNDVFNIGYTFGEDLGIHGSATATRNLVDGYFYQKLKQDFYRSNFENELVRLSAAYRFITGKQFIAPNQPLTMNVRGWKEVDQNIDVYLRFQRLALLQCPTCQYILSTQPINRSTLRMTRDMRARFVALKKDLKIGGGFITMPDWENIIQYSYGRIKDEMPEVCASAASRCRYKSIDEVLPAEYAEKSKYFVDDVHLTSDGNKFIADYYASIILNGAQSGAGAPANPK